MAIRIRKIKGYMIALCAARTKPQPGDIYLDDTIDSALRKKFLIDYESEGIIAKAHVDNMIRKIVKEAENEGTF